MAAWLIMILMMATSALAADIEPPIALPLPAPVENTENWTSDSMGMENPTDQEIAEMMNLLEVMELLNDVDILKDFDVLMEED